MAFEPFGLVGGLSVGIPPITIINDNGVATLNGLQVNGLSNLGPVGNIYIAGGVNGYFLQTDGAGHLTWAPGTGGNGGNGTPGGANSQVQFNNAGTFGGDAGFTYDNVNNSLSVSGNISAINVLSDNYLYANGSPYLPPYANYASYAGNVTNNSQPNITSVGTLIGLNVSSDITAGNSINATFLGGTLTTSSQPNITSIGTLGYLNINTALPGANGNITFNGSMIGNGTQSDISITGDLQASNIIASLVAGVLTTNEQPNVTSVGNLSALTVVGPTNLGNVSNLTIYGGSANFVLTTDGFGDLSWKASGGGGAAGGTNTQVQFNNAGLLDGNTAFTFNNVSKTLSVVGTISSSNTIQSSKFISTVANGTSPITVTSTTTVANLSVETATNATFAISSTNSNVALTVANGAQPNITSVGTLTGLSVAGTGSITGNIRVGNLDTTGTIISTTSTTTGNANVNGILQVGSSGQLKVLGNINTASSSNIFLGNVENIHISGGLNGYVLSTDGSGNLTWSAGGGGGGNGTPGGSNTQVQYNDSGTFGGSAFLTFNENTNTFQVAGNLIANTTQIGAGVYKFSTSSVYAAITASTSANQLLWSVNSANVSGVDFHIIATDIAGNSRQVSKISSLILNDVVQWNEYGSLLINGGVGSFDVIYTPGNIIVQPQLQLVVTPDSSNTTSYKMQITEYAT